MVFLKENLPVFVGGLTGVQWVVVSFVPLAALVSRPVSDTKSLAWVSVVGLLFAAGFEGLLLLRAAATPGFWPDTQRLALAELPIVRWRTLPLGVGVASFCNEGLVVMAPTIHQQMSPRNRHQYGR
jgi:hypothetical protein